MTQRSALAASGMALDERQAKAVRAPPGPLLVLAGAGSGKTRVLTERAAAMVEGHGLPAAAPLVITFTNRAAAELRARLAALIGEAASERMTIGTFHAVCHRLLRAHAGRVGRSQRFSVYDAQTSRRLIAETLDELKATALGTRLVADQIGQAKARLIDPAGYLQLAHSDRARKIAEAYASYERALERSDALDFDDLIVRAVALFADMGLAARYRARWTHVLVDEYQDTNPAQDEWLRRLAGEQAGLTVVGDPLQAIYGFRAAAVENILSFERRFAGTRVVALERNYRSSGAIVACAARLARHAGVGGRVEMWTDARAGPAVAAVGCADEREEADAAAAWCRTLLDRGVAAGEIAVLYRTRAQARPLEDSLLLAGVPCRVLGSQGLWESAAVRDLVAHLSLLSNPRDRLALGRALRCLPGVGPVAVARVLGAAERHGRDQLATCTRAREIPKLGGRQRLAIERFGGRLRELAERLPERGVGATCAETVVALGIAERLHAERSERSEQQLERLRRLCRAAARYEHEAERPALAEFLAQGALATDDEAGEEPAALVTLSTLHAAKGGEWDHVRLVGVCEGLLPHRRALAAGELDEERRLAYVGITRARRELALSWPRTLGGRPARRSRFLAEAGLALARPKANERAGGREAA
jgi:DNA helicase II / ATP-dependent DNA helicase PcrA